MNMLQERLQILHPLCQESGSSLRNRLGGLVRSTDLSTPTVVTTIVALPTSLSILYLCVCFSKICLHALHTHKSVCNYPWTSKHRPHPSSDMAGEDG